MGARNHRFLYTTRDMLVFCAPTDRNAFSFSFRPRIRRSRLVLSRSNSRCTGPFDNSQPNRASNEVWRRIVRTSSRVIVRRTIVSRNRRERNTDFAFEPANERYRSTCKVCACMCRVWCVRVHRFQGNTYKMLKDERSRTSGCIPAFVRVTRF